MVWLGGCGYGGCSLSVGMLAIVEKVVVVGVVEKVVDECDVGGGGGCWEAVGPK